MKINILKIAGFLAIILPGFSTPLDLKSLGIHFGGICHE
jgi:hypothetical protein